jgi:hypothetical protein
VSICDALRQVGPSVPDTPQKQAARLVVWECLQRMRLRDFNEDVLDDARAVVFTRLVTREYRVRGGAEAQCVAYLRTAVRRAAIDIVTPPPPPPPRDPSPPPDPSPPDCSAMAELLDDVLALWGKPEFKNARAALLSQELLRRTSLELMDIASGRRRAVDLLMIESATGIDEIRRRWGAYKRACERTIKAWLLTFPRACAARGGVEPSFPGVVLRELADIETAMPANPSREFEAFVRALVAVATCYQRALVGAIPTARG